MENKKDHLIGMTSKGNIVYQSEYKNYKREQVIRFSHCPGCGILIDWKKIDKEKHGK